MYQAGIKNITLYENKGIKKTHYDPLNLRAITALSGLGTILFIDNFQRPEFDIKIELSKSGRVVHDYTVKFLLLGLTLENYDLIQQIKCTIYGWVFLVEFYDGSFKFYDAPVFAGDSEIKPHEEMSFEIELKSSVPSREYHLEYTPDISTVPIYRADTTILSADTTIYTADYAL